MKFWLYLTGSLFILAVYSCEYNTKEIFKRDLNKNTNAPDIQVVDLDLSQEKDTVELLYNRVNSTLRVQINQYGGLSFI